MTPCRHPPRALLISLIARYGSERSRGHGMPEAIEALLLSGSWVEPRVAFFKSLSAAISIGPGSPFGAEGPIIMTQRNSFPHTAFLVTFPPWYTCQPSPSWGA